jgi:hypothetical protein
MTIGRYTMPKSRGQPRRFTTGDQMVECMNEYLQQVKEEKAFPNIAGFCVFADINKDTFFAQVDYYSDSYKKVNDMLENAVLSTPNFKDARVIVYLKNKFKYTDQIDQNITVPNPVNIVNYDAMSAEDLLKLREILSKNELTTDKHK